MLYLYEFEIIQGEKYLLAFPFDMDGATQGKDIQEVTEMAADWLRMDIENRLMHKLDIPKATFGNEPKEGGRVLAIAIDVDLNRVEKVSASDAARMLDVSPPRVTHMIKDGLLEAFKEGHKTWVTLDSVKARLAEPRKAGRPRKTKSP